jgi:beta-lactamase class A
MLVRGRRPLSFSSLTLNQPGKPIAMSQSRRVFLGALAAATAAPWRTFGATDSQSDLSADSLPGQILALFKSLPGINGLKIFAPATSSQPKLLVQLNPGTRMLVGSVIKSHILCATLYKLDSKKIAGELSKELVLDASVWSPVSPLLNPPNLIGMVSFRTALEAMIMHSDNTGTDMALLETGFDYVQNFVDSIGLTQTQVPLSTRAYLGYLYGAANYKNITWAEIEGYVNSNAPFVNPPLNNTITLASSANDLISYYSRALVGDFFLNAETTAEFLRILSLATAVRLVVPLGATGFGKGGNVDTPGYHAYSFAGGMFFSNRWVFFSYTINWTNPAEHDPATVKKWQAAVVGATKLVFDALS